MNNRLITSLFVSLMLFSLSCSDTNLNSNYSNKSNIIDNINNKAILKVNFKNFFKNKFNLKSYKFDDSNVDSVKISVYWIKSSTEYLLETEREIKRNQGISEISLALEPRKSISEKKIVIVQSQDTNKFPLTRIMAAISLEQGTNTTLKINYGTTPIAEVLKKLVDNNRKDLAFNVDLSKLQDFVNKMTGYNEQTNSYSGINPSYFHVNELVRYIINNNGDIPVYSRDNTYFDNEIKGKINVTLRDSNNNIVKNGSLEINDLTSQNVSSISEDTTTIENISQGSWILKVKSTVNGKSVYLERTIDILEPNQLNQNINIILPNEITVDKIELKHYQDNENIPLFSNSYPLVLSKSQSNSVKALVTLIDRTTNENITWETSDSNIASVSSGTITGNNIGFATITAKSNQDNTKFVTFRVKVLNSDNPSDAPRIDSFFPNNVSKGTIITIKGSNFELNNTKVIFNNNTSNCFNNLDVEANCSTGLIKDITSNEIKVEVPSNAITDKIIVKTSKGIVASKDFLIINNQLPNNIHSDPTLDPNFDPVDMIYIPKTEFIMGKNETDKDYNPAHKVILSPFYIDRTEVTNKQFKEFIDADGYTNCQTNGFWSDEGKNFALQNNLCNSNARPSYWNDTRFNKDNQPVVGISWYEAEAYARFKGKRLPTEAEWELAARGTNEREYPWGNDSPSESNKKANGFFGELGKGDGFEFLSEVAYYTSGDSPYGLKDMSGNAYEWVNDWYSKDYYSNSPLENPKGPNFGGTKVLRGGSWYNHPYFNNDSNKLLNSMKTYYRFASSPANRSNYIGFRTAK
ncbi:MAG: hypothetical protein KatS3mg068_2247 [Candidatus Sericytochromatia bacterium]|nr:MAG: hypothetical protein KatS3mg068_2247 [Candidatus Sericytochromatia bacterium]